MHAQYVPQEVHVSRRHAECVPQVVHVSRMHAEYVPQVVASDDDNDEGEDATAGAGNLDTNMDLGGGDMDELAVKVNAIDAYWLQRQIADAYTSTDEPLDAAAAQQKERDVLRLLGSSKEDAELEGDLVYHLDYKRFKLIKVCCVFH
jgi:hypothetical protein